MKTTKILLIANQASTIEMFKALLDFAKDRDKYKIFVTSGLGQIIKLTKMTKFNWIIMDGELDMRYDNDDILEIITNIGLSSECVLFTCNTNGESQRARKKFNIRIVEKNFDAWKDLVQEVQGVKQQSK